MKEFSLGLDVVGAEVSDPGQQRPDQAAADERDPGSVWYKLLSTFTYMATCPGDEADAVE